MHVVTKIFVIFATILSVFLSALVISFSSNAAKIADDYEAQKARAVAAEAAKAAEAIDAATQLKNEQRKADLADRSVSELRESNRKLLDQLQVALQAQRSLQDSADRNGALAQQLGSTNQAQAALIEALRKDADDSRKSQVDTSKKNAELEKALADLRRSYEAAENEKKLVREQLVEAKNQLDALRASGAAGVTGKASEPFTYNGPNIAGKIEELSTDAGSGASLVRISVGSADNIRDNMKLAIRRGDEFLGNLVIVKTDLRFAIGRVDLLGRQVSLQVGDAVQTDLSK